MVMTTMALNFSDRPAFIRKIPRLAFREARDDMTWKTIGNSNANPFQPLDSWENLKSFGFLPLREQDGSMPGYNIVLGKIIFEQEGKEIPRDPMEDGG